MYTIGEVLNFVGPMVQGIFPMSNGGMVAPELDEIKRYAWYAAAATCPDSSLMSWKCESCLHVKKGTEFLKDFENEDSGTKAYLAVNTNRKKLILAFRGTEDPTNDIGDSLQGPFEETQDSQVLVHQGLLDSVESISTEITQEISAQLEKYPGFTLVITGHSTGGAMASLAAITLKANLDLIWPQIELYTYGQPRTGNEAFAKWFDMQPLKSARVVNNRDIVPHLVNGTYAHHQVEVWIDGSLDDYNVRVCKTDVVEDPSCSNSIPDAEHTIGDHLNYFDTVMGSRAC